MSQSGETSALLFVLSELNSSLQASMPHWDPQNVANGMAINRMNTLLEFVTKVSFKPNGPESSTGLPSTKQIFEVHHSKGFESPLWCLHLLVSSFHLRPV